MNNLLLIPFLSICMFQVNNHFANVENKTAIHYLSVANNKEVKGSSSPTDGCYEMMATVEFKNQQYCRVELPADFDFDARFNIQGATVLFSGAGFEKGVIKTTITSASLKPISSQMAMCKPGSIVIFEKIKVIGPDNVLRIIPGKNIKLY